LQLGERPLRFAQCLEGVLVIVLAHARPHRAFVEVQPKNQREAIIWFVLAASNMTADPEIGKKARLAAAHAPVARAVKPSLPDGKDSRAARKVRKQPKMRRHGRPARRSRVAA
jgi:hypothetical protein